MAYAMAYNGVNLSMFSIVIETRLLTNQSSPYLTKTAFERRIAVYIHLILGVHGVGLMNSVCKILVLHVDFDNLYL